MKLSFIFELLLIFVFIAFAASAAIDKRRPHNTKTGVKKHVGHKSIDKKRQSNSVTSSNRYCSCNMKLCNCCREFNLPVVSLQGPGCASLQYLKGDRLAISMSFGERVLTNTTISSRKPQPVCMPLPGGISKFCGRVYNIKRADNDFQACLGLELRTLNDIEASLRVSCFKFGPRGLRVEPSQPLPVVEEDNNEEDEDEDDDDDDDDFDFDADDDDDDDDDDDENENDVDETPEYGTFSVFDDDFIDSYFDSETSSKKKPVKKQPTTTTQVSKAPFKKLTKPPTTIKQKRKPVLKPKPTTSTIKITKATSPTPLKTVTKISTTHVPLLATSSSTVSPANLTESVTKSSISVPEPVNITSEYVETVQNDVVANTETQTQDLASTTMEISETTTIINVESTTTVSSKDDISDDSIESSGSEENPIAEAVEDILDETSGEVNKTISNEATDKTNNATLVREETDDDVSDILDGVVESLTGEDSTEDKHDDDDDDDDDESSEDNDDDRRRRRKLGSRQSRDMWLDRLHW